ncbi:protein of unknown function DUF3441 [Trinorchestia longiramus]|nr:protein of unknown function DUF3441 [Trinorchestia longiramus]
MKLTFTSFDIRATVSELKKSIVGLRVNQIYDVDHKTYLIKLHKPDHKAVLLIESASRLHTTVYEWPKNPAPSGFSMKLRKHLRNKRLEKIEQLGADRVVQLTFGSGPAEHHLIIELYDRGNITLTDANYTILIILRPRKDGEDTRFAAHEVYPINNIRTVREPPSVEQISEALEKAKPSLNIKKVLNPLLDCGGGVLEHELTEVGVTGATVRAVRGCADTLQLLCGAAAKAQQHMLSPLQPQGFIVQRSEHRRAGVDDDASETVLIYEEFLPMLYAQHTEKPHLAYESFNRAVDEFFQQVESQKLQSRAVQQEKEALKKLENVRSDHTSRVHALQQLQDLDTQRGQLIELNRELVDAAISQMRAALAHQLDWREIEELLQEAQEREEPVALAIKSLSLATNTITMMLSDPYDKDEDDAFLDSDEEREEGQESSKLRPTSIEIDLDLSAYANATKYYASRRRAGTKVQKTMAASAAALKSATRKTKQTLKEVRTTTSINKVRKVHWFEKFLWFISSENYLVLAGHDQQQNEVLVKRHLKSKDVYVHADLHGAASVIIKNSSTGPVPPSTLHQAGIMALCYSRAWAEKVVTSAWWVWGDQVSKSAPTGEYLTTGSFMVRGKKNFLPPSHLVYGFGFLFRLEESSIARHSGERSVKLLEEAEQQLQEMSVEDHGQEDEQLLHDSDQEEEEETKSDNLIKGGGDRSEDNHQQEQQYPDTVVQLTHVHGDTFAMSTAESVPSSGPGGGGADKGDTQQRRKQKSGKSKTNAVGQQTLKAEEESRSNAQRSQDVDDAESLDSKDGGKGPLKRGQKSRMKKMKTKYKDQDEEERQLMMELLKSDGPKKEPKRQKGKKSKKVAVPIVKNNNVKNAAMSAAHGRASAPVDAGQLKTEPGEGEAQVNDSETPEVKGDAVDEAIEAEDDIEDGDGDQVSDDLAILHALTGLPVPEDELLYCVPMCAPYNALSNYKYKVKLTPGPGKKGKACKAAVALFLSLKPQVLREADLIRAVRDSDLAKNVPGKVKVSAPNFSKVKK